MKAVLQFIQPPGSLVKNSRITTSRFAALYRLGVASWIPSRKLVKIEPKAIGVGQYQHDVDQGELKKCLDDVVISCVNAVGVEVNTSSPQLLSYVSGLGPSLPKIL
jgi:hypothetical protein